MPYDKCNLSVTWHFYLCRFVFNRIQKRCSAALLQMHFTRNRSRLKTDEIKPTTNYKTLEIKIKLMYILITSIALKLTMFPKSENYFLTKCNSFHIWNDSFSVCFVLLSLMLLVDNKFFFHRKMNNACDWLTKDRCICLISFIVEYVLVFDWWLMKI